MFDNSTQRACPHCDRSMNWAAPRCGFCWRIVSPLTRNEAADAAIPYSNRGEALRLLRERDSDAIETLLNERDRLLAEARESKTRLDAISVAERLIQDSADREDDEDPSKGLRP